MEDTETECLREPEEIVRHIRNIYRSNHFMADYFGIAIESIACGCVTVSLRTDSQKHTNHRGVIHGGVFTALADSVMGVTGASVGAAVVTASLTMTFHRNVRPGEMIRVTSHITHHGRSTIVIAADMRDEEERLMSNILATMIVVERFPEIPSVW